jgi:hypothetical protein
MERYDCTLASHESAENHLLMLRSSAQAVENMRPKRSGELGLRVVSSMDFSFPGNT